MPETLKVEPEAVRYPPGRYGGEDLVSFLHSLLLMVRRRIGLILVVTVLGTGLAAFVGYHRTPHYTAQALVMLEPTENRIVNLEAVAAGLGSDDVTTVAETQTRLLTSPVYLARLAERLDGVAHAAGHEPELMEIGGQGLGVEANARGELTEGVLAKLAALVPQDWLIATGLAEEKGAPADPEAAQALRHEELIASLARALQVKQEGRSLVLSVSFTSKDPAQAAQLANILVDFYIQDQISDKLNATKRATSWLEMRLGELKGELESSEQAIERYRSEHRLLEDKGLQINSQQVSDLTNMLISTRAARSEKETRLRYIRELQAKGEGLESVTEVLESPYLSNLWQQQSVLQRQEADLRTAFGDKHPKLQNLLAEKQNLNDKIHKEISRLVENISNEIAVLAARERSIQADIDALLAKTDVAGQAEVQLHQLERQAEANRKLYEEFLQRYKETKEQQEIVQPNAKIIAHAKEPTEPSSLPMGLFLLAGFLGSSMAGVGLSWVIESLDNGVRSGKQIEGEFGLRCLGLIPSLQWVGRGRESRPHRYLLAKPLSAYAETIRSVHTALRLSNSTNLFPRVIQVTSSIPGEGKTVFAVSLATLLAQSGYRTLLLDLDLRHPSVRREIVIPDETALISYVMGELAYDDLIHHDRESGLDIVAVQRPAQNPAAILASPRLRDLVQRLRKEYSYVIIDSTPVLGVSDSKVTSEFVDAVLFVVRWQETTFDTVQDSLKELTELRVPVSGAVLTQVDVDRHARYGYGGIDNHYKKYKKYYQ